MSSTGRYASSQTTLAETPTPMAPAEVADAVATRVSTAKATLPSINLAILGALAGAYIGFGAAMATLVTSDAGQYLGFGVTKLLGGFVFSVGLILVVIAGAELFTGNNLMVTGVLGGQVGVGHMLLRWAGVYVSNFAGSILLAGMMFGSMLWMANDVGVGLTAVKIAHAKVNLSLGAAFFRGIGCNWLVCLAVWMALSARETAGKILAIIFPITAFVALGYEHCVANMYFIPFGLFLKNTAAGAAAAASGLDLSSLTWGTFLIDNLLPVTVGNIVGGGLFVGALYWAAYLRVPAGLPPGAGCASGASGSRRRLAETVLDTEREGEEEHEHFTTHASSVSRKGTTPQGS